MTSQTIKRGKKENV